MGERSHLSSPEVNLETHILDVVNLILWEELSRVALRDVVGYLAGVCGLERTFGVEYDIGGLEVMTYREMIERIARLRGKRPLIVEVPVLTPYLSSLWLHLVTPVNAGVARPLVEGLRNDTLVRDDRIRDVLPIELTSFESAARLAFEETE